MVGHLGAVAVAAVGVGLQILFAVNSVLFAFGTGALAIVARHIGAGERRQAEETLRQAIVSGVVASILVAIPVVLLARPLVAFFQLEPAVVEETVPFLRLIMAETPGSGRGVRRGVEPARRGRHADAAPGGRGRRRHPPRRRCTCSSPVTSAFPRSA